jgi:hypothetical protein
MNVTLRADATPSASALFLRPWHDGDVEPLIEAHRDPVLRRWTRLPVENAGDAVRWLDLQRRGWESGERLSFAVLEDRPGTGESRLAGNVVLKRTGPGRHSAEVGYWTAAPARGRQVAPRALEALTRWAFTPSRPRAWHVSTFSTRWTIPPPAGSRRRPDTSSTRSCRRGRPSPGTATCTYGGPALLPGPARAPPDGGPGP